MKSKYLLSICVPVFNQEKELGVTLQALAQVPEIDELFEQGLVEVNLSDNASSTQLREVVGKDFSRNLNWFRQPENLGFRGNLRFLAENAHGKYVWFIGAGERIESRHFSELLAYLESGNFKCGTLGTKYLDAETGLTSFSEQKWVEIKRRVPLLRSPYTEAIAGNIYSRDFFVNEIRKPLLTGDMWPHVEIVSSGLRIRDASRVSFFPSPVVTILGSIDGWWKRPGAEIVFYKHMETLSNKLSFLLWPSNLLKFLNLLFIENKRVLKSVAGSPKRKFSDLQISGTKSIGRFVATISRVIYLFIR